MGSSSNLGTCADHSSLLEMRGMASKLCFGIFSLVPAEEREKNFVESDAYFGPLRFEQAFGPVLLALSLSQTRRHIITRGLLNQAEPHDFRTVRAVRPHLRDLISKRTEVQVPQSETSQTNCYQRPPLLRRPQPLSLRTGLGRASLTCNLRSWREVPLSSVIALSASLLSFIWMKANPRGWPESRSVTMLMRTIRP